MDVLWMLLFIISLPILAFIIPIVYGDKTSKDMLKDLNSNPTDYTE